MIKLLTILLIGIVSGYVRNSSNGAGICNVVVSDGYNCTTTDSRGYWSLNADSLARTISISVPGDYEIPLGTDGRPAFFKYFDDIDLNFSLTPRKKVSDKFTVIAIADPHLRDQMNFKRLARESIPDLRRTAEKHKANGPVIGISLGDQMWDVMSVAPKILKNFKDVSGVPFFYCIGNHDHNSQGGKNEQAVSDFFVRNFAPTDYSFNIGNAHIIVMDNIQYSGIQRDGIKIAYSTGITDAQLEWLRQDISHVVDKGHKAVIFCCHAPMFGRFANKDGVRKLLNEFAEAHVLSGHEHNINNVWIGNIWEHNIQSIGGAWWYSNLSPNGSPLGYSVMCFDGNSMVEEYNKATTESDEFQMRVYDGNDSYNEKTPCYGVKSKPKRDKTYGWPEEYKGHFIVRVWDGTSDWTVKFIYKGQEYAMKQTSTKFFDAASCAFMVDIFGGPYGGSAPYKAKLDTFWTIEAPGGDPSALKNWEIVAEHHMPSGKIVTYRTNKLMRDYHGFATGNHYYK